MQRVSLEKLLLLPVLEYKDIFYQSLEIFSKYLVKILKNKEKVQVALQKITQYKLCDNVGF